MSSKVGFWRRQLATAFEPACIVQHCDIVCFKDMMTFLVLGVGKMTPRIPERSLVLNFFSIPKKPSYRLIFASTSSGPR